MKLSGLAQGLGRWLDGSGPASDVVLSTRVRLARNLKEVPFTHRAREEQLAMVYSSVVSAVRKTPALVSSSALQMRELTPLDRQFLVERHLISHDLADNGRLRGLLLVPDESVSAMVNEEDHLRLQALASGFQLRPLLRRIHGDTRHRGKSPTHGGAQETGTRQIQRLHDELQRAVEREEFEKAAGIRDEIRKLETERATAASRERK